MQNNPQELSWSAIQAIVGVKLPSNVLRFDDIGFHLVKNSASSGEESDSDVEIIENDWESDYNASSKADLSDAEKTSPERAQSESPILHLVESDNNNLGEDPSQYKDHMEKNETKDIDQNNQINNEDADSSSGNVMSIENYLEVTLSTETDTSHTCSQCKQMFQNDQALLLHRCSSKPTEEKKYPCRMCAENFPSYWELRKHMNNHFPGMLDSKSSFCHLCQKDYTKTGFMNHLRKHTGERPFVCELCHKAFSQSSSLSIHMKFHLNVRKHACTVCEKKFVTKSELSRHMTVHTKQKSYYCGVCEKAFTRSDNMKKHEKTHG